jgi:RsiW-degrading membrane proteinase PrsW (M82 family)
MRMGWSMKGKAWPLLVILLLLSISAPALAQSARDITLPASAFAHKSLEVSVGPTSFNFTDPRASETLNITVRNPTDASMDVYLALYRDRQWSVVKDLGRVEAGAERTFSFPVNFTYSGKTVEIDEFGVAGRTYSGYVGSVFSVIENWSRYEDALKASLSFFGVLSAVILLCILVVIMAGVLSMALHMQRGSEYTLRTLFFPVTRMRPWAERIAYIVINPFFWLFEMLLGAILVAIILWFTLHDIRPDIGWLIFAVGGVAAVFMPVIFLVIGWLADYYEREPFRFIVGMFMWGIMATFFAFFINTTFSLLAGLVLSSGAAGLLIAIFVAPVVEETAKGTGLLILSGHHEFDSTFDGILFGFAIGMGFAFIENWLYFATNAGPVAVGGLGEWTYNILYRSLLCSLAHGCFTATTGAFIGYFKARRKKPGFGVLGFFLGLPLAVFLHGAFNFTAVIDYLMQTAFGVPLPIFDPLLTIAVTVIYICLGAYLQLKMKRRLQAGSQVVK